MRMGHDGFHAPTSESVTQLLALKQCRRGNDDSSGLNRPQHHLPKWHRIAKHHQNPITRTDSEGVQEVRHLRGAAAELGESQGFIAATIVHHAQRWTRVVLCNHVEIILRPVKVLQVRPAKLMASLGQISAAPQHHITRGEKSLRGLPDHARPCSLNQASTSFTQIEPPNAMSSSSKS